MEEAKKGEEMNIIDNTGRKLKVGQILDVMLIGMFKGKLIGIKESPIALSKAQVINPHIIVAVSVTPFIAPNGLVPDVYIIGEPNPDDPLVKEAEGKSKSRIIVD